MADYKVIITTSGIGSRLGSLTEYTNKCLVRVADKPAISYIIESYPIDVEFIITLGHFGNHVKQFLQLAYPNNNFTFIEIDKYKGDGSSLGYSLLQCKHCVNKPFIFHASDTIIKNLSIPIPDKNYVFGSYKEETSQYRTVNVTHNKLIKINEKGEIGFDFSYVGICLVKDYELFFSNLEKLIYNKHQDTSDVHVINNMLNDVDFFYKDIEYGNWFDIGNTSELIKTRKKFNSSIDVLDKKDESIFFFDNFVIKFFSNSELCKNRVLRANKLIGLVPEILDWTENFYKYKKANGHLFSKSVNRNKFIKFLQWSLENLWIKKQKLDFSKNCYEFYINKTKKRIEEYLKDNTDPIEINGQYIGNVYDLLNQIDSKWISNGVPSQFHGDFILDNVIETENGFCLIDWRQDFAGELEVGDLYYDLAKLNHNLTVNHDLVKRNFFNPSTDNCYILTNSKLNECKELLNDFLQKNNYDIKKVNILTSLIWINMAPLHDYPFNNFLFNFGKYNLFKNLKL